MNTSIINTDIQNILEDPRVPWEKLRGKSVLITGAGGMIPSYLVRVCQKLECEVTAVVSPSQPFTPAWAGEKNITIRRGIPGKSFDYVIHGASPTNKVYLTEAPELYLRANIEMLEDILEEGPENVLFLSAGEAYGVLLEQPTGIMETQQGYFDQKNRRSFYGECKHLAETLLFSAGVRGVSARIFHTYGPGISPRDERIFGRIVRAVHADQQIVLTCSPTTTRSFSYLSDTVRGLFLALLLGESKEIYNVGNPNPMTVYDFTKSALDIFGRQDMLLVSSTVSSDDPMEIIYPNTEKLQKLGWDPVKVSFYQAWKNTVYSYRDPWEGV